MDHVVGSIGQKTWTCKGKNFVEEKVWGVLEPVLLVMAESLGSGGRTEEMRELMKATSTGTAIARKVLRSRGGGALTETRGKKTWKLWKRQNPKQERKIR